MKSLGRFSQRTEIRQFLRGASAEKQHQLARFELAALRRRRRHSVMARIGALPVPVQIITISLLGWLGMRKLTAERPCHLDRVAYLQVAK